MHTFFINTSGKELGNYSEILEIQHETRRLVSLECPLTEWNDEEKGYKACVSKMGELIDSYKNLNNEFNLILYIDLLAYEKYTAIPMNRHRERYACLKALHSILKHYINSTFVYEMNECGRAPQEVLLIFEENQPPKDGDETTEDGKNLIRSYVKTFLGLPNGEEIDKIVYNTDAAGGVCISPEQFCEKIAGCNCSCLCEKVLHKYLDQVDTFISEAKGYETSAQPMEQLLDRIIECTDEDDKMIRSVTFATNRRAGIVNKQENARRNLRLAFYVLSCVEDETVFDKEALEREELVSVKPFPEFDWDEVAVELKAKSTIFQRKYNETQRLSGSFSEMKLAPPLYAFDNERFALDEYGKRGKTFAVVDVEEVKDQQQEEKDIEEGIVRPTVKKAVAVRTASGRSMFSEEEYPSFDYRGDGFDDSTLGAEATVEQYVAEAKKLRQHHLDYLQSLKVHVSDRLSNYAGRSAENEPALLRKRKVSMAEEDFDDPARDYRYAKPDRAEETRKLKAVEPISKEAYTSAILDYMEFCAGRSVAVTDVEEQCNWFVTRVHQITASLRKTKLVAVVLLLAIIVLYIPFVVIQWEAITENGMTLLVALLSVAIPIVVLYTIFALACSMQRKKYREAWKEFKEKSDRIIEENAVAAEKYDRLLQVYVPTLRWVYEYKLDVEFYAECCKLARAKIGHHIQKLHDRVITIGNIIEDLELESPEQGDVAEKARDNTNDELDYNVSFCSGKKNKAFYSIIDRHFLESVHK